MKDLSILFFAGYLLSALFLLPLTILYLSLGIKKTPIPTIHRLHKALVLLSVVLPLGMVLVS